jgi:hypothetical protein
MARMQATCSTVSTMVEVKELIVVFNQTLRGYGFSVTRLYDTLLDVLERYTSVLAVDTNEVCNVYARAPHD